MRVTDIWNGKGKPAVSFEFFPPRVESLAKSLAAELGTFAALKPDCVSVTFGAGGSSREGSRQLVSRLFLEQKIETIVHFGGYGMGPAKIIPVLDDYKAMGIENVLVLRGDAPQGTDFVPDPDSFKHARDLVKFIKARYDFCVGVGAYPEGHIEATSREKDWEYLRRKVDEGAEYIMTNYSYLDHAYVELVDYCQSHGMKQPVIPGMMPIYTVPLMERIASLCGAKIPESIRKDIAALPPGDEQALIDYGIELAMAQCKKILAHGVAGIHLYTMDRTRSTVTIVNRLRAEGLIRPARTA